MIINIDKIHSTKREAKAAKGMRSPKSPVRSSVDLASIYLMRNMPEMRDSFFSRAKKLFDPPLREVQSKYMIASQSVYARKLPIVTELHSDKRN